MLAHQENLLRSKLSSKFVLLDFQYDMVIKFQEVPFVLCGDDMGLGKTYEGIALDRLKRLLAGYPEGYYAKTLVITVKGMIGKFARTYRQAMPNLLVKELDPKNRTDFSECVRFGSHDVYIMHWDALRLMPELAQREWFHIIADEVHKVKSRKAQVTRALKKLKTKHKLGMSGTPGDNKPDDLWSPLNWLYPKKFTSYWGFVKQFCDFEQKQSRDGVGYFKMKGIRNEGLLQREMAPFFIRRRKEEVLDDLPEKYYDQVWIDLTPRQRKIYDDMRKRQLAWIGEEEDTPFAAAKAVTKLMRLQQIACGDIRVDKVWKTFRNKHFDPARRIEEYDPLDPRGTNWQFRKALVDEYHIQEESTKLNMAMDLIDQAGSGSVIIFTWWRDVVAMMLTRLQKADITHCSVTGVSSKQQRDNAVELFQAGKRQVFVGTYAGREGVDLFRSSTEIFIDRAWNPTWNRQAEDRAHRIGQKNAVQVIDIMARNTVDLGRHQQIQQKWTWLQMMMGDSVLDYQEKLQEA
jgi:SNF2 family DNA or RNA helicase